MRTCLVAALTAFASIAVLASQNTLEQRIRRIEHGLIPPVVAGRPVRTTKLEDRMRELKIPAVSMAVFHDGRLEWLRAWGMADVAGKQRAKPDTRFQAASISKPVAAMAAVRLAQEGRFSLDDDINSLLKSWKVPEASWSTTQRVTPRSLLSHTSGADDGFGFPGYDPSAPRPTPRQVITGESPSNTGPVVFGRPPYQGF